MYIDAIAIVRGCVRVRYAHSGRQLSHVFPCAYNSKLARIQDCTICKCKHHLRSVSLHVYIQERAKMYEWILTWRFETRLGGVYMKLPFNKGEKEPQNEAAEYLTVDTIIHKSGNKWTKRMTTLTCCDCTYSTKKCCEKCSDLLVKL